VSLLIVAATLAATVQVQQAVTPDPWVGAEVCADCHSDQHTRAAGSPHALDSRPVTLDNVPGPLEGPDNVLATENEGLVLEMTADSDGVYQSLVQRDPRRVLRRERMAISIGAVKGRTYLYWNNQTLRQLPASYLDGLGRWVYSPGIREGDPFFEREVFEGCLVCHATHVDNVGDGRIRPEDRILLGITCERCHGPGREHVEYHEANPESIRAVAMTRIADLDRERQLALCGQCHSGTTLGERRTEPFSFRPGDRLEDHYASGGNDAETTVEMHSNQVALLAASVCFQESPSMTCTTCHTPHGEGRVRSAGAACLRCHAQAAADGHAPVNDEGDCVGCHMPAVPSRVLQFEISGERSGPLIRSHRIAVYPAGG